MSKFSPVSVLYDAAGNALGVIQDGADYVLRSASKIAENPSNALQLLKVTSSGILKNAIHDGSGNALSVVQDGSDYLLKGASKIALNASDALQFLKVTSNGILRNVLNDGNGNEIKSVQDGADYLLGSSAKTCKKEDNSLHHLGMTSGGMAKMSLYTPEGSTIAFPITSSNPSLIVSDFVRQTSGTDNADLRVNGSSTSVEFKFSADSTYNLDIIGFTFVIVSNSLTFGASSFAGLSKLTNGVLVQITAGGNTGDLYNITQNECFLHSASIGGFNLLIANKDVIQSSVVFGGAIRLTKNTSDHVGVVIRDNLSSGIDYFKCSVQAIKEV